MPAVMAATPFRANALAGLSSPEQLDTAVRVTRPRAWVSLAAIGLLLVAFIAWALFGTFQSTFPAAGILLTSFGTSNTVAIHAGHITRLLVTQGDAVTAGAPVAELRTATGATETVRATQDGHVTEILAYPGDQVAVGAPIVTLQPSGEPMDAYLFVPVASSQPIKPGMPVQLSVTTVPSEQYGLLLGTVAKVGSYPVTRAGVNALLNNPDLTSQVIGGNPVIQIEVALTRSSSSPSGYAWTSGDGPPTQITAGSLVNATIILATRHPVSMLFPSERR
ncbi:HlyD family efflux transporter periplasmic adaptor subunit [Humibacter antri]